MIFAGFLLAWVAGLLLGTDLVRNPDEFTTLTFVGSGLTLVAAGLLGWKAGER